MIFNIVDSRLSLAEADEQLRRGLLTDYAADAAEDALRLYCDSEFRASPDTPRCRLWVRPQAKGASWSRVEVRPETGLVFDWGVSSGTVPMPLRPRSASLWRRRSAEQATARLSVALESTRAGLAESNALWAKVCAALSAAVAVLEAAQRDNPDGEPAALRRRSLVGQALIALGDLAKFEGAHLASRMERVKAELDRQRDIERACASEEI